jgi:xanthine dehydrogenase molybdopterin-binding subunit B
VNWPSRSRWSIRLTFAGFALTTGYYRTPGLAYDKKKGHGIPFYYFAYGAAISEVEVDGLTGMKRVLRVDILQDVGDSLNPNVDRGQIEGAFVQGMGWLTGEELKWNKDGRLLSHSASTYQIPVHRRRARRVQRDPAEESRSAGRNSRQQSRGRTSLHAGPLGARSDS